jgi:transcriptional regulator with XRE-family HTH domain
MVHEVTLGIFASPVKTSVPHTSRQTANVEKDPSKILSENLTWLMQTSRELTSQAKIGAKAGIDQKTVGRILNRDHSPTLDKLASVAAAFGVEVWQLLAPRLGADLYQIDSDRRVVPVRDSGPPVGYAALVSEHRQVEPEQKRRAASG